MGHFIRCLVLAAPGPGHWKRGPSDLKVVEAPYSDTDTLLRWMNA